MAAAAVVVSALAGLAAAAADRPDKRGLCFVPSAEHPDDNALWTGPDSSLTWYYNYQGLPSPAYADRAQQDFEFVPMMWGVGADPDDTAFLDQVQGLLDDGTSITHVLGFNEPDAAAEYGGSDVRPRDAARAWVANLEPLAGRGVRLGLPACTGGWSSLPWLEQFLGNCSALLSEGGGEARNCTWDFLPVHWYDNFAGLASHIGERRAKWPDAEIWVTEYAFANQGLDTTQEFFNQTLDYLDKEDYIGRYAYFGAFRSEASNVGPDAVFLNNDGHLTDLGAWYLGEDATGVDPQSRAACERRPGALVLAVGVVAAVLLGLL